MLITAIGITKKLHPYASESRRAIQEFLARHNLQPYLPQCAVLKTADLTLHYEHGRGLVWPDAAWEEVRRFPQPLIAHIGEYWLEYSNTNAVSLWQWRSGDGRVVTFDTASDEEMERFWRDIRESAAARGVTRPWVLIDEPPASAAHGLTPTEYETRRERGDTLRAAARSLRAMVAALTAQLDELESSLDVR